MRFSILKPGQEWDQAYKVIFELRPHVTKDQFFDLVGKAHQADQYEILGAFDDDVLIGVMGYRVLYDIVHGRHLYIDDLVVTESRRSQGVGAQFLQQAESIAKKLGIDRLRLCTGVENRQAIRFYEREGWQARAFAFKKKIEF